MEKYRQISSVICKITQIILGMIVAALVAIVFWQVLCRYVFQASNGWTQEVSTLLFVWATYLGAALAVEKGMHISMQALAKKIKTPYSQLIQLIAALLCEAFYALYVFAGLSAAKEFINTTTPSLRIPMYVPYGAIISCGLIMFFLGVEKIIEPIRDLRSAKK